jgi:hypothetical protein
VFSSARASPNEKKIHEKDLTCRKLREDEISETFQGLPCSNRCYNKQGDL